MKEFDVALKAVAEGLRTIAQGMEKIAEKLEVSTPKNQAKAKPARQAAEKPKCRTRRQNTSTHSPQKTAEEERTECRACQ